MNSNSLQQVQRIKPRNYDKDDISEFDRYFSDVEKIRGSKSLRRLAYKTQVFTQPNNSHVRTRLVHSLEVVSVALTIARRFNMLNNEKFKINEKLVEAIALGHDTGHTPFGHRGEEVLGNFSEGFRHERNSVVMLELIERRGRGLCLTKETLLGIIRHSKGKGSLESSQNHLPEHTIVMYSDKIAYLFADLMDAQRYKFLDKIPEDAIKLGLTQREQTKSCIDSLIKESLQKGYVSFTDSEEAIIFSKIKMFMYENVYSKKDSILINHMLESVCEFFSKELPNHDTVLLASMLTDSEVMRISELLIARTWDMNQTVFNESFIGISEIIPYTENFKVDYTKINEDWINSLY